MLPKRYFLLVAEDINEWGLTLIKGALEENLQLLFKTILHHDALS